MKILINLTKIYFKEAVINFIGKSKRTQAKSILLFIGLFAFVGVALGFNYFSMADALHPLGLAQSVLTLGILTSSLILIFLNTKSFGENFYNAKDYEMLSSMPIKSVYIILAKYISLLMVSTLFVLFSLLPAYIAYFIYYPVTVLNVIYCLLSFVFIPAFSQFLGCVISWISNLISSRMSNKNLIAGILGVIFAVLLVVVVTLLGTENMADMFVNNFPLSIKIVMPIVYFLNQAITTSNILYFLAFIGVNLLYVLASAGIIILGYKKINTNFATTTQKHNYKSLEYNPTSVFVQLLKKESKKFFSTAPYFINVMVGPILALCLPFVLLAVANEVASLSPNLLVIICTVGAVALVGVAPASATAISVEGSSIKTLKALPISHTNVLWAKVTFNFLLNLPAVFISQVLMAIILKINIWSALLAIIIGIVILYFISLSSLFLNLIYPKLEWTSVAYVVKQSISVLLAMLVDMIASALPVVVYLLLPATFNVNIYLIIVGLVLLLICVILTIVFNKKSKELYNKLC